MQIPLVSCANLLRGELLDYTLSNYFADRKGLYFIEAFGDYWHSEQLTGLSKEQGFVLKETFFLQSGNRYTGKDGDEPIFVFCEAIIFCLF